MIWKGKIRTETVLPSCLGEGCRGGGVTGENQVYLTVRRMCVRVQMSWV